MQINEMNLEEVEARLAEISGEVEERSGEELETLKAEVVELQARKAELEELELRKKQADDLNNNKVVPDKIITERKEVVTMEYRTAFLKHLKGEELSAEERAAYSTLTNASAAVPEELQADIITKAKEYAPILNEIKLLNVPGGVKFAIEGDTDAATTHTELATITAAADSVISVVLSAYEITKLITISATVKNMTIPQFEDWLIDNLAEAVAMKIENLVFCGTGSAEAQGILTVKSTADASGITAENIYKIFGKLKSGYARNGKIAVSRNTFFTSILPLEDDSKNKLVVLDNGTYRVLGAPVMFTDSLGEGVVIYGDFKKYVANLAAPQQVVNQFDINTNAYKYLGVAEFDGKVALADAFVVIKPE